MACLNGLRVLVVEDEGAVAMLIEEMLEDFGCVVVASVARLAKAREVSRVIEADLAILDVNLAGELVFPVAEILRERNIPFIFSTGYGVTGLQDEFALRPVLHKPFSLSDLEGKIGIALK
ncbi:response regulator [Pseudomonas mucidolens]|uniref:Response regulator receiver domain-containing protein n=1 Tax=Pseudomonas mucidolens TaxID=46679 RepID=A0A1H2MW61_9PSED|nr:response regulator [Pseudomonas mucidolens]SDU97181.1 Response regulator receiver domain-containing protein [Pseudomonas mucidolens]SQH33145.1 CheY family response regulator [Pseudomonas mucidolens]